MFWTGFFNLFLAIKYSIMSKIRSFFILFFIVLSGFSSAQQKVLVTFKDKNDVQFNPYEYFDFKAIERRNELGLSLYDPSDFPVNSKYVDLVSSNCTDVLVVSRWLNGVICNAQPNQIERLRRLPFVLDIEILDKPEKTVAGLIEGVNDLNESDLKLLESQTARMGAQTFTENDITGKGVRVAIFDIGFESYKTNPAFDHIRKANRIVKTWDFVKKKENVDGYNTHGTFVLSCVAGKMEGVQIGLAIDAEFLLARTETWTEFYSEEEQWLAAAEWADKNGAHIINSSLGYTYHRYFPEQMNGKKSLVSRAATMAARKGILVVNSAGNEGDGKWKIIGTPADADSVLSIGGISPWTGYHTGFSSFGPTSDKRLKPNVTAYGHVIGAGPKGLSQTQGTSFSGPLTAGFAACAKQARPNLTNMELFKEIEKSADLYPYFDYAHGYGVPQASYFFRKNIMGEMPEPLLEIEDANGKLKINILDVVQFSLNQTQDTSLNEISEENDEPIVTDKKVEIADTYYTKWPDYVFYHIENNKGYLDKYWVVDPQPNYSFIFKNLGKPTNEEINVSPLIINKVDFEKPFILRVYYKGQIKTHTVNN